MCVTRQGERGIGVRSKTGRKRNEACETRQGGGVIECVKQDREEEELSVRSKSGRKRN